MRRTSGCPRRARSRRVSDGNGDGSMSRPGSPGDSAASGRRLTQGEGEGTAMPQNLVAVRVIARGNQLHHYHIPLPYYNYVSMQRSGGAGGSRGQYRPAGERGGA